MDFRPAGSATRWRCRGNPDITIVVKGFHSEVGGEGPESRHRRHGSALRELRARGCAAEPGILTYLDLPLISGKAAPGLR